MPAKYVRPYSKGQKSDLRNAEAIAGAVQRPTMRFVVTNQLDLQALHRVIPVPVDPSSPNLLLISISRNQRSPPQSSPFSAALASNGRSATRNRCKLREISARCRATCRRSRQDREGSQSKYQFCLTGIIN